MTRPTMNSIRTVHSGEITVRLVHRIAALQADFILIYDSPKLAALYRVTDEDPHAVFDEAVAIADAGLLKHPAWQAPTVRIVPIHEA